MGFSKEIKERVFVASARRCCICKKFSGINMEVHHIKPVNEGGEDSYENAIPLCFDCHANAGHYNPMHPRGSRFSPNELREHRDNWYKLVESGQFSIGGKDLSQQFFLTNSFEIVSEIINGDFSNFPINEIKLYQNELYYYLKEIDIFTKRKSDFYNYYNSVEEYKKKFPDAISHTDKYGMTYWTRIPQISEIKEKFYDSEYVVNYMIRNNAVSSDFCTVIFNENGCTNGNYERFNLKEFKVVFLTIFNSANETLTIKGITETYKEDGGFISLDESSLPIRVKKTNELQLEIGKCLIVPYCVLLGDLENNHIPDKRLSYTHIESGQSQDVRPIELINGTKNLTIGVRNIIRQIQFEYDNFSFNLIVKSLDQKNLLLISRFWECGSCPHLFGLGVNSLKWQYICEVFRDNPGVTQEFVFNPIQFGFDLLKIVELENEVTEIDSIIVDDKQLVKSLTLRKGDEYTIPVKDAFLIKIIGKFSLLKGERYIQNNKMKMQKILYYIADN